MAGMTMYAMLPRTCSGVCHSGARRSRRDRIHGLDQCSVTPDLFRGLFFYFNSILNFSGEMSFCRNDFSSVDDGFSNSKMPLR